MPTLSISAGQTLISHLEISNGLVLGLLMALMQRDRTRKERPAHPHTLNQRVIMATTTAAAAAEEEMGEEERDVNQVK
jgi:hypothetical protein